MKPQHQLEIRVRYHETDGQGRVHHAQYLNYFERGRIELLRSLGHSYRELEASGLMLVVTEMNVKYFNGAQFDDLLMLTTRVDQTKGVRIYHSYSIARIPEAGDEQRTEPLAIVDGTSVIACVDRQGKVCRLPSNLRAR
jgi:acyl-CoA thioester hydrolase